MSNTPPQEKKYFILKAGSLVKDGKSRHGTLHTAQCEAITVDGARMTFHNEPLMAFATDKEIVDVWAKELGRTYAAETPADVIGIWRLDDFACARDEPVQRQLYDYGLTPTTPENVQNPWRVVRVVEENE